MVRKRSEYEIAAGKLISCIQKEWGKEAGEDGAEIAEDVMSAAHHLLQARSAENARNLLGGRTVAQYLDEPWISMHPDVWPAVLRLQELLEP